MHVNNLKVGSAEEYRLIEKVKLSYLKNRGNIITISDELSLPIEYVKKLVKKFKGKESRDVSTLIANTLMQQMMFGYESRVQHLMSTLKELEGRQLLKVSVCCEAPLDTIEGTLPICCGCNKEAKIKEIDKEGIIDLKLGILAQLREEDKTMMEFAVKMGYTQQKELPAQNNITQHNVIFMGKDNKINEQDEKVVKDLVSLSALERDILAENLIRHQKEIATASDAETKVV
jgi:hypothetical protein